MNMRQPLIADSTTWLDFVLDRRNAVLGAVAETLPLSGGIAVIDGTVSPVFAQSTPAVDLSRRLDAVQQAHLDIETTLDETARARISLEVANEGWWALLYRLARGRHLFTRECVTALGHKLTTKRPDPYFAMRAGDEIAALEARILRDGIIAGAWVAETLAAHLLSGGSVSNGPWPTMVIAAAKRDFASVVNGGCYKHGQSASLAWPSTVGADMDALVNSPFTVLAMNRAIEMATQGKNASLKLATGDWIDMPLSKAGWEEIGDASRTSAASYTYQWTTQDRSTHVNLRIQRNDSKAGEEQVAFRKLSIEAARGVDAGMGMP